MYYLYQSGPSTSPQNARKTCLFAGFARFAKSAQRRLLEDAMHNQTKLSGPKFVWRGPNLRQNVSQNQHVSIELSDGSKKKHCHLTVRDRLCCSHSGKVSWAVSKNRLMVKSPKMLGWRNWGHPVVYVDMLSTMHQPQSRLDKWARTAASKAAWQDGHPKTGWKTFLGEIALVSAKPGHTHETWSQQQGTLTLPTPPAGLNAFETIAPTIRARPCTSAVLNALRAS